jgi:hypothetical protein
MDLEQVFTPRATRLEIKHPATKKATGLVLEIVSDYDARVKAAERAGRDKVIKAKELTPELAEENYLDRLVASVTGWEWNGDASWGGKKLAFTPANVATVLGNGAVRSQVEEARGDTAAFFAA